MHINNKTKFFCCCYVKVIQAFHSNLQYLVDTVFSLGPEVTLYHGNHPIIFIFGGGLMSKQFKGNMSECA